MFSKTLFSVVQPFESHPQKIHIFICYIKFSCYLIEDLIQVTEPEFAFSEIHAGSPF